WPGAVRRLEEPVDHRAELAPLAGVRGAGVGRRPGRGRQKAGVDGGTALGEARAVEEALLVESLGDLGDLAPLDELAVAAHHALLDVGDRVLAVEERDDVEQRPVQERDRRGVAGRIAQRHALPALVLDRKRLDPAQARRAAHVPRYVKAEAT